MELNPLTFCHRCRNENGCSCGLMVEQSPAQSLHDQAQAAIIGLEVIKATYRQRIELAKKRAEIAEQQVMLATPRNPNAGVRQAYPNGRYS